MTRLSLGIGLVVCSTDSQKKGHYLLFRHIYKHRDLHLFLPPILQPTHASFYKAYPFSKAHGLKLLLSIGSE